MRLLQARVVVSRVATNGVGLCAVAKLFEAAVRDDCSTSMATYRGQSSHPVESTVTQTTIPCTVDAVRRDEDAADVVAEADLHASVGQLARLAALAALLLLLRLALVAAAPLLAHRYCLSHARADGWRVGTHARDERREERPLARILDERNTPRPKSEGNENF